MGELRVDFLRGAGFQSYWIERFGFGWGGFSHCAGVLADNRYLDARSDVIGGVPAGVHIRKPETERAIYRERWSLPVSDDVYASWEANMRAKVTDSYGTRDILDFLIGRPGHVAGSWICSALWINSLQHVHLVPYPLPVEAHQISPDSALLITATAGFKKSISPVI